MEPGWIRSKKRCRIDFDVFQADIFSPVELDCADSFKGRLESRRPKELYPNIAVRIRVPPSGNIAPERVGHVFRETVLEKNLSLSRRSTFLARRYCQNSRRTSTTEDALDLRDCSGKNRA